MTENKLYAQCISEATEQIIQKLGNISEFDYAKINQLTAEIYGMKLLDMSQPDDKVFGFMRIREYWHDGDKEDYCIGTTQDLHDHFVEQFNVSLINEGNNGKQ